ncbi:hypothetical protein QCN29_09795 [Streptomyces sp. HNM0663]|uniref:Uncharacterized protein n=1 Tax=Streptomyces chengmaiensis TaxID=3040919 RepID=A0ABT6HK40_9ACTN|nr:hypothetical protein [Streptomyces chengmaiensis]MDH2389078.1 hypothetical protein [Streptomyces chengmaiensis]
MSELMRRPAGMPVSRQVHRELRQVAGELHVEQARTRAVSSLAENAMGEVAYLKRQQAELERMCPDAAEALALIANTAAGAIAKQVHRFGNDLA